MTNILKYAFETVAGGVSNLCYGRPDEGLAAAQHIANKSKIVTDFLENVFVVTSAATSQLSTGSPDHGKQAAQHIVNKIKSH